MARLTKELNEVRGQAKQSGCSGGRVDAARTAAEAIARCKADVEVLAQAHAGAGGGLLAPQRQTEGQARRFPHSGCAGSDQKLLHKQIKTLEQKRKTQEATASHAA